MTGAQLLLLLLLCAERAGLPLALLRWSCCSAALGTVCRQQAGLRREARLRRWRGSGCCCEVCLHGLKVHQLRGRTGQGRARAGQGRARAGQLASCRGVV